jgi:hypothetical protein
MKYGSLLFGVSLLALGVPVAHAQQTGDPGLAAVSGETQPGTFMVFFELNQSTLTADARGVIAEAAEAYRTAGAAQITVTGHADRSASEEYNLRLSERRADAVRRELERLGVPASSISTAAMGETDPLVPTADGVREARNRRVVIMVPQAEPAAAATVEAAAPPPPPMEETPVGGEAERPRRFTFALGPLYGHNFKEQDEGETENDLLGVELTFNALPGFLGGLSFKQGVLWSLNGVDDGLTGRSVLSLDFAPDLGIIRPFLSANFGGVYGEGVQDGFVAGPEIGLAFNLAGFTLRPKVAYDYQFRNSDFDEGIIWGGLDLGIRF